MSSELAEIRKELEAISNAVGTVKEVVGIRSEVDCISRQVDIIKEVVDIRKEVEDITKSKDNILKEYNAQKPSEKKKEQKVEEKANVEADKKAKEEADRKAKEEANRKAKEEADKKAKEEADRKANAEADKKAKEEADRKAKEESDKKAKEEADRKAKEEADRKTKEEANKKVKVEASSPPTSGQPPKEQQWGRGELLSTCCKGYYDQVRDDKSDLNWVLLKHESNTKVRAEAVGNGSLSEVVPLLTEKDTAFVYIRFKTGDQESVRAKFVLISWCGQRAPIMRKAKMSVHKADVKDIFYSSAIEIHATEPSDLDESAIIKSLIKAGGANYNGQGN